MRAEGAIDLQTLKQAGTEMQLNERMTQSYVQLNASLQQTKMQEIEEVQQAEGLTSAQKTAAIQEIQTRFSSEYAWLDTLFGNIKEWNWDGV